MAKKKTPAELMEQAKKLKQQAKEAELKEDAKYGTRLRQLATEIGVSVDEILLFVEKHDGGQKNENNNI